MKIRFNDPTMQSQYENLVSGGMHWKRADAKIRRMFGEYDQTRY